MRFSVLALGLAVTPIHAADTAEATRFQPSYYTCVKASGGVTSALNDCIGTEHDYQDKRLNTAYQALRKTQNDAQRATLRTEEREWITARDKACDGKRAYGVQGDITSPLKQVSEVDVARSVNQTLAQSGADWELTNTNRQLAAQVPQASPQLAEPTAVQR